MILTHAKNDLDQTDIDQGFSALLTFCGVVAKSCPTLVTPMDRRTWQATSMGFSRQEYLRGLPFHSRPRNQTWVSWIVGMLFTIWAMREAQLTFWGWKIPCCGGCPVHCRMFSSTPDLSPLDASSTHLPIVRLKCISRHNWISPWGKISSTWKPWIQTSASQNVVHVPGALASSKNLWLTNTLGLTPDLLNQDLVFKQGPQLMPLHLEVDKHWSKPTASCD